MDATGVEGRKEDRRDQNEQDVEEMFFCCLLSRRTPSLAISMQRSFSTKHRVTGSRYCQLKEGARHFAVMRTLVPGTWHLGALPTLAFRHKLVIPGRQGLCRGVWNQVVLLNRTKLKRSVQTALPTLWELEAAWQVPILCRHQD